MFTKEVRKIILENRLAKLEEKSTVGSNVSIIAKLKRELARLSK